IDDPALLVEQEAVAGAPDRNRFHRKGKNILKAAGIEISLKQELSHMADIEERGLGAAPAMFGDDPLVLDRHVPTAKWCHQRIQGAMPFTDRRCLQRFIHSIFLLCSYYLSDDGVPEGIVAEISEE